ncbi:hypothetical protein DH2020_033688 [Rehmannia glutinosa]|uniref:B box-type domain-containing protein n=1 Tax=Rehmannia glutinosa TaxID=99300 RepID=A0ABR0VE34_REHGL
MKIQCNVCEAAEATVLCCADEAALCWDCDRKVHAANKLASKHQRIPLSSSSSQMPMCDICQHEEKASCTVKSQCDVVKDELECEKSLSNDEKLHNHVIMMKETVGYFFCLEDRALLCRKCDVAIHTANSLVSAHQRFLLTGVKVALEDAEAHPSSSSGKTKTTAKISEPEARSLPKRTTPVSSTSQYSKSVIVQASECGDFSSLKPPFSGGSSTGNTSQWQLDEFIGLGEFTQNYSFMDSGSPKADYGKLGDSNCSQILRAADGEFDGIECIGQVPETF